MSSLVAAALLAALVLWNLVRAPKEKVLATGFLDYFGRPAGWSLKIAMIAVGLSPLVISFARGERPFSISR